MAVPDADRGSREVEPEPVAIEPEPVAVEPSRAGRHRAEPEPVAPSPSRSRRGAGAGAGRGRAGGRAGAGAEPEAESEPSRRPAVDPERARAILDEALDALGAAHHRPFSRG